MASLAAGVRRPGGMSGFVRAVLAGFGAAVLVWAGLVSFSLAVLIAAGLVVVLGTLILGAETVAAFLLVLGFATLPFDSVRAGPIKLCDVFFVPGFLLLLSRMSRPRTEGLPVTFAIGAGGLFVVGTLAAVASAPQNLSHLAHILLGVALIPWLMFRWRPSRGEIVAAALAYMAGTFINVVASLINGPSAGNGRYQGLSSAPNALGTCAMLSLALVPFLLTAVRRSHVWIVVLGAAVSAYGIWISGSRIALVGGLLVALVYPVLARSTRGALLLAVLSIPAIVYAGDRSNNNAGASNALSRLIGNNSSAGSDAERKAGQHYGLDWVSHHPFTGGGDWHIIWGVHDTYLQLAAGFGLFGLTAYLILLVTFLRPLFTTRAPYRLLSLPALVVVLTGFVDPALAVQYAWFVVALALSAHRLADESTSDPVPVRL